MDFPNDYFTNLNQQKRFSADEETLDNMVKRQRLQQQQQFGQLPSSNTPTQVSPPQVDSDSLLGQSDAFSSFNFQPYTPTQSNFSFPFRGPSMLPPPMHNIMQQQSQPSMDQINQQSLNQQQHQQQQQQQQQLNYMFFQQQPPFFSTQRASYPNLGQFNSAMGMGGQSSSSNMAPITAPVLTMESPLPDEPTPNYQSIYKFNPPQQIASSAMASAAQKKPKRGTDPMKKKEGLEESSVRIIGLLQTRGKMIFKDIHETLNIDYRRAYDILNILLTTTLITKVGKKRENKLPFIYQDGTPLPEPVEIRDIMNDIQREEELNATLKQRIALLEEELNKEDPNFKGLKDRDPLLQSDPLYKDLV